MFRLFIDRPILASVISIVIMLAGFAALRQLAVEQYPNVVPPQVVVTAMYPGASAEVAASAVAAPLEQEINGVDNMVYMESTSSDSGMVQISISFDMDTDPDQAAINVNNRVQAATARLPQIVRDMGIRVQAQSTNILMVGILRSTDQSMSTLEISNYTLLNVLDELVRLNGVGNAALFGLEDYAMRVWLDPARLARYNLTTQDVALAIREQNAQYAAGSIGAAPGAEGQPFTFTVTADGQLGSPEAFEQILIRSNTDGASLRLGDLARVELGSQDYSFSATYNADPAVPFGVFLQPGANALETATRVRAALDDLATRFPPGLEYRIPYDTTEFVEISIREVTLTLLLAVALVMLVTFVFLQHIRATLIPVAAIPVSLIGTFAGMQMLGFSINMLTLFGLVLAIGIVVDNAIIVMENVERLMKEEKLRAREAAIKTMQQVSGAVVSSTLVLVAVFAPVAFIEGLSGELYRQFAVTIAVSVVVSGVVALTLTPAMCALLLDKEPKHVAAPFRWFNAGFERLTEGFVAMVSTMLQRAVLSVLVLLMFYAGAAWLLTRLPGALVPAEDQGVAMAMATLPAAASLQRSEQVRHTLSEKLLAMDEVEEFTSFAGFDMFANANRSNALAGFINLTHWRERRAADQSAMAVAERIGALNAEIPEANIMAFTPPPVMGLSLTGGVEGYLQLRGESDIARLEALAQELVAQASQRPEFAMVSTTLDTLIPRYHADIDEEKARAMGVAMPDIFSALQSTFGAQYVNDFSYLGRLWRVYLQAESEYRSQPEDIQHVYVRSQHGDMVPLSALMQFERRAGADIINRFNAYPAARIMAEPAPGYTSGQTKSALEDVVAQMQSEADVAIGWIGEAYQLDVASGTGAAAFAMGLLMVFLILAAQYERITLPLAVAAAVPFAVLGGALFAIIRGFPNDIYFQVGLLVLIGLAAKNAILIVEFAAQNKAAGMTSTQAAVAAARQRLRAILMTAATFIIGTLPLMFATGAGAASRQEIGSVAVGGMIAASTLALLFVPLAYKLLEDLSDRLRATPVSIADESTATESRP